jgi:hypothetical protein
MTTTTSNRTVPINQVVYDQADFFQADGSTRETGLGVGDLGYNLFFQNVSQPWPLVDGTSVTDAQIRSGSVYFNEVAGSPGYYSVRLRPNAIGFWRLLLSWAGPVTQTLAQDYDVTEPTSKASGLSVSFQKDC